MSDVPASMRLCVLTPPGRGAVAVIAVSGGLHLLDAHFQAANAKSATQQSLNSISYGHWGDEPREDVILLRSGEADAEIHCHGGTAAIARILQDLQEGGAKVLTADQWLGATGDDWSHACRLLLPRCLTLRSATLLWQQSQTLSGAIAGVAALEPTERLKKIERMLAWADFGIHLADPWQVVVCGRPNVGKSSLINALLGYARAVVFDQPGTTRDVLTTETAFEGWPVQLSDTAGLREAEESLEAEGISRARDQLRSADLMIFVLDAQSGVTAEDLQLLNELPAQGQSTRAPLVVWNKCDLRSAPETGDVSDAHPVSAKTGAGLDELMKRIARSLVPQTPADDEVYPVTTDQVATLKAWQQGLRADFERFNGP